jgi:hypothetical protein
MNNNAEALSPEPRPDSAGISVHGAPAADTILRIHGQGWRGMLPVLPYNAVPDPALGPEGRDRVLSGRGKAPGQYTGRGWRLLADWPTGRPSLMTKMLSSAGRAGPG